MPRTTRARGQRHICSPGPGFTLLIADEAVYMRGPDGPERPDGRAMPHIDYVQHAVIGPPQRGAFGQALRQPRRSPGPPYNGRAPSEFRILGLEIVDDDEIEIRTRRHPARAEPAERKDRGLLAADTTVDAGKIGFDAGACTARGSTRRPTSQTRRLLAPPTASRKECGRVQEHMLLAEQADCVEHVFVGAGLADSPRRALLPGAWR